MYKLKDPDDSFSNILSRSISTYDLNLRENQEWNEAYVNLVDLFLSVLHDKSNIKLIHDIQLLSGVEILFNYAAKLSSSGCMCVLRQFDGKDFFYFLTSHLVRVTTSTLILCLIYIHHQILSLRISNKED
jgi:hypothetical protein